MKTFEPFALGRPRHHHPGTRARGDPGDDRLPQDAKKCVLTPDRPTAVLQKVPQHDPRLRLLRCPDVEMSIDFGAITAPAPSAGSAETTVATQVDKALANGGVRLMKLPGDAPPPSRSRRGRWQIQQLPAMPAAPATLA